MEKLEWKKDVTCINLITVLLILIFLLERVECNSNGNLPTPFQYLNFHGSLDSLYFPLYSLKLKEETGTVETEADLEVNSFTKVEVKYGKDTYICNIEVSFLSFSFFLFSSF